MRHVNQSSKLDGSRVALIDGGPVFGQPLHRPLPQAARAGLVVLITALGALAFTSTPALAAGPPEKPVTEAAKEVTATTASFHGVLNPNVFAMVHWSFAYSPEQDGPECVDALRTPEEEAEGMALPEEEAVTELEPNKKYELCLIATNGEGEARGNEVPFTTPPAPPKVDGESVHVTSGEATLEAQINPNNENTTYSFEYSSSEAEVLAGKGKKLPGASPLEGFGDQTAGVFTGAVLAPEATYFYRVAAKNTTGTQDGPVHPFTTVPSPFTGSVTAIAATGARFNGTLSPLGAVDTEYYFDYKLLANGAGCAGESQTAPQDAGTGAGAKAVSTDTSEQAIELQPNAAYSVCLVSANAFGSDTGQTQSFTTLPAPPKVDGESESVTSGVELEAQINPNNQETAYAFEYSTEGTAGPGGTLTGAVAKVEGVMPLKAGFGDHAAVASVGAAPATTYYYRVLAENEQSRTEGKPAEGEVKAFTTPSAPAVTTGEAQGVTRSTGTFTGTVNPEGAEATYYFAYIDRAGYEKALEGDAQEKADPYAEGEATPVLKVTEAGGAPYTGTEPQPVGPIPASALLPGETYYYALIATSDVGVTIGSPATLTTLAATPPIVTTGAVSGVSQSSATLTGTVDTNSLQTDYGFEIGAGPENYGPATGLGSLGGALTETVSVTLSQLQPGRTYYYRVTASNADGTVHGEPNTFTTPGFPTLLTYPAVAPLVAAPNIAFPNEKTVSATSPAPKGLTKAQKLKKALKACSRDKSKTRRARCMKQARRRYGSGKKGK